MDDPTRRATGAPEPANPEPQAAAAPSPDPAARNGTPQRSDAVANAMHSLLSSAQVSVVRGEATRVFNRSQPPAPPRSPVPPASSNAPPPPANVSSGPPGPRVDYTLWVVLAVGLFAIAGYMLSAAL